MGKIIEQPSRNNYGDTEEKQYAARAIGNVANDFGETDDVNSDRGRLVFSANLRFQRISYFRVDEFPACLRINFQQRYDNNRPREIIGHELADAA